MAQNSSESNKKSYKGPGNLWIILLGIICAVSLVWMIWVLLMPDSQETAFTPPPFEEQAVTAELSDLPFTEDNRIEAGDLLIYVGSSISEENDSLDLTVWNSNEDRNLIRIRVTDEAGKVLGETGLLKPGEMVDSIPLDQLSSSHRYIIRIMGYEPDTYYSAGSFTLNVDLNEGGEGS